MVSGAGQSQIPPAFGALLAAQQGAAERLLAGTPVTSVMPAIPMPEIMGTVVTPVDPGAQGLAGFSGQILGQLASLLARSGEAVATSPPRAAPGAAPPGAAPPPGPAKGGNLLAEGAESPGQPEMDATGTSTGGVRPQGASPTPVRVYAGMPIAMIAAARPASSGPVAVAQSSAVPAQPASGAAPLARLADALLAATAGGSSAGNAPAMLRREVVAAASAMAETEAPAAGVTAPQDLRQIEDRARTAPVAELVAMAQALLQQTAVAPGPSSADPLPTAAAGFATEAGSGGAPVTPGIRQVVVAAARQAEDAGTAVASTTPTPRPAGSAGSAPSPQPAPAMPEPTAASAPAGIAARNGLAANPAGVTVEGIVARPNVPSTPAMPAGIGVTALDLPQWNTEPVRFFEAGAAAPVPATQAPVSFASPIPDLLVGNAPLPQIQASIAPSPVVPAAGAVANSLATPAAAVAVPTDTGLPQETAPAAPGPSGVTVSPGPVIALADATAVLVEGTVPGQVVVNAVNTDATVIGVSTETAGGETAASAGSPPPSQAPGAAQPAPSASSVQAQQAPAAQSASAAAESAPVANAAIAAGPEVSVADATVAQSAPSADSARPSAIGVPAVSVAPAGEPGNGRGGQAQAVASAGPAPVAPATPGVAATPGAETAPGAISQAAAVAGNGGPDDQATGAGVPRRRAGEDPLESALARAQGATVTDSGAGRPAATPGSTPAMGDPALQAAVAQLTEEIGQTPPGTIRDIELRLNSEGLGRVRVRLKLLDTGAVRIEFTTPTERAAQVLRGDLPQLVAALEGRGTVLDGSRVLVAPVGAFAGNGSSDQSRQGSRWFERPHRRNAGTAGGPEGFVAAAAYGRRQLVDVLA